MLIVQVSVSCHNHLPRPCFLPVCTHILLPPTSCYDGNGLGQNLVLLHPLAPNWSSSAQVVTAIITQEPSLSPRVD